MRFRLIDNAAAPLDRRTRLDARRESRRRLLAIAGMAAAGLGVRLAWPGPAGSDQARPDQARHDQARADLAHAGPVQPADPMVGAPAPPLSGPGPDGVPADLSSLGGMLVMVNVWASWCQPCWEEMPVLLRAQHRWRDRGLRLFGLNTADLPDQAHRFMAELGVRDMPVVCDPDRRIAHAWGVHALPQTVLVGRSGTVVARRMGVADQRWLDATIPPML